MRASTITFLLQCVFAISIAAAPSEGLRAQPPEEMTTEQMYPPATAGKLLLVPRPVREKTEWDSGNWQLPARHFSASKDWLALVCKKNNCTLQGARLRVNETKVPQYDGDPVLGQELVYLPLHGGTFDGAVIAALKSNSAKPKWFKPGVVKSYYAGDGQIKRPKSAGTMEALIDSGKAATNAILMPVLWLPTAQSTKQKILDIGGISDAVENGIVRLQLRSGSRRQFLGDFGFDIEGARAIAPEEYLNWAGDLDGDGQLDLLIEYSMGQGTSRVLYLSSQAGVDEITGQAASFNYFPIDSPGC
jgi:hypothetical protein